MLLTNFRQIIQYDAELGHKYVPNQRACLQYGNRNYLIHTDERGFRNALEKRTGRLRIIFLGDSYTSGYGITNPRRFTELLESEYDCEVVNLAVSGYGVDQQVLAYQKYAHEIEHDIVVFMPLLDDLARACVKARTGLERSTGKDILIPKPYFEYKNGHLELHNVPVPKERIPSEGERFIAVRAFGKLTGNGLYRYPQYADPNSEEWRITTPLIERLKELAGEKNLLVAPIPMNQSVINKEPSIHLPLFKRFEDEKTFVHDINEALQRKYDYDSESVYLKICGHFSEGGHRIVAEELSKVLAEQYGLQKRRPGPSSKRPSYVLGISCFYHDSAACLIKDGAVIAAAQEERFTRVKHDKSFPLNALNYCLETAYIGINELEAIVYYDYETWTIERVLHNVLNIGENGQALWDTAKKSLYRKLKLPKIIRNKTGYQGAIFKTQHHVSHAAGAYYPSPFDDAAILIIDGVGEWACTTIAKGKGNRIEVLKQQFFPHSLGLLYSAFTFFTGFKVNSGEYKLMGLAPYGKPIYYDRIVEKLVTIRDDGSIRLSLEYFSFQEGTQMTNDKFAELFDGPPREREARITKREMDLAASIQKVTEEVVAKMANHAYQLTRSENLVLAGGVALNCVANGHLFDSTPFKDFYFQPAAGDAGAAEGCALSWYLENHQNASKAVSEQPSALLGPAFSSSEILAFLQSKDYVFHPFEKGQRGETIARFLYDNQIVGHFDGRMEFGPRALGARSVLANPLNPEMQSKLNLKIKYRESFRPFAPIYKENRTREYFDFDRPSPYMLVVRQVNKNLLRQQEKMEGEDMIGIINQLRSELPAITHVDNSARLQSVNPEQNHRIYDILDHFEQLSGKGVLINTSFNVRGEPIVCNPSDAYRCFMRTEMDILVLGDFYLLKPEQPVFQEEEDWRETFVLD